MLDFWGVTPWKLTVAAPSPKKQPPSQKRKSLELSKHQFSGALAVSFVIFHALEATQNSENVQENTETSRNKPGNPNL